MDKKNENGEESVNKDGSICGYDSLHTLLSANLKPHIYQVTNEYSSLSFFYFNCVCV